MVGLFLSLLLWLSRFFLHCLRVFESARGVLERLAGTFVSGQMIFFPVLLGGHPVIVSGKVVQFGGFLI